ncbi:MAG: aminotransferase class V-fold PLP-dependent enzyme [Phycisphaerales bacterium]|nr:aminotransferase class V-fold PLP-dependent enzyme [Phycisphaerales bacterium]
MRPFTKLVAFDPAPGDPVRPVATPIYQTATFDQESASEFSRYDYSRSGNPTRDVLESLVASLEGASRALCYASGLAAITAVTRLLKPGDEIIASDDLYGGSYRLFSRVLADRGVTTRYIDLTSASQLRAEISSKTKLVYTESLTNPMLRVCPVRELADVAHASGALLCVDSTSLSPYLHRPIEHGADLVIHSATKYLCGHSDVTAGVLAIADAELAEKLKFLQNAEGVALGPFDAFLLLRGIKTLGVRIEHQQRSAARIARTLARHPSITAVHFPGLSTDDQRVVHERQASGPGAVLSFETGSAEVSRWIVESLKLFNIAVSFGGVNSSASLPWCMSHSSIPEPVRATKRFPPDLVRLSIGLEDPQDLIDDLTHAIARVTGVHAEPKAIESLA